MTGATHEQVAVSDIAAHYRVPADAVQDRLNSIPAEMASLFASPFGWAVLGEYVSASLGVEDVASFMPTVH